MSDKNNNNPVSDQDEEPTVELELSEEDCARLALAAESSGASESVVEHDEAGQSETGAEPPTEDNRQADIQELEDALTFLSDANRTLQQELTETRGNCMELEGQIASLKATNAEIAERLDRECRQVAKSNVELNELRDRENALQMRLSRLDTPDGSNVATTDQSDIIDKLESNNRQLTARVSALEEELDLARRKEEHLEHRLDEAREAGRKRLAEPNATENAMALSNDDSQWVLVSLDDTLRETYLLSAGIVTVGSGPDSDIAIPSRFISRKHAQFVNTRKACVVGDLNSTNGTYVNSRRINKRVLRAGDIVTFGKHRFRYEERSDGTSGRKQSGYDFGEPSRAH